MAAVGVAWKPAAKEVSLEIERLKKEPKELEKAKFKVDTRYAMRVRGPHMVGWIPGRRRPCP
ncbi:hypothetical protein E2562_035540 [Oryza meyeriana var. granulata]|uniref:Uncharacterized protein n=1 Tax=Oryza meyeriana var. granulata TaxID=110450 RepID=A0A6G1E728_9ORYZ|nr:hypothetical protein E2562_035540 [Oryza meyeriana var. granulata]